MFGGLAFLLNGNMSVTVSRRGGILVRIDPDDTADALTKPHVSRMEMGKRKMNGWIYVEPDGIKTKRQLEPWVKRSVKFAKTLPKK
jgi:TfoX/Sxy family transcriptional regulator of competence genes